jgi:ubiquinone biosynthesis protein
VLKMIFEDRFFHADLHPGNLFIHPDGTIALIDFGMVAAVTDELRGHLSRLFIAIVRGDASLLTSAVIATSLTSGGIDRTTLHDDLRAFLSHYRLASVRQTPFARMMTDLFAVLRRNRVRWPHEMTMLLKALLLVESLAMSLDPDFRLGETLEPYAERLARERVRASAIAKRLLTSSADVGELALDLPGIVRRLMDAVDTAGIQVHLRAAELEPLLGRAERIGNRLVAGMVGAGLTTFGALSAYLTWTARRRRG